MPSVKNIGKPYAGKPHVRFDEGGLARACLLLYRRMTVDMVLENTDAGLLVPASAMHILAECDPDPEGDEDTTLSGRSTREKDRAEAEDRYAKQIAETEAALKAAASKRMVEIFPPAEVERCKKTVDGMASDNKARVKPTLKMLALNDGKREIPRFKNIEKTLGELKRLFGNFSGVLDDYANELAFAGASNPHAMRIIPRILNGPAGVGKTAFAQAFARALGLPFLKIAAGGLQHAASLCGGSSYWSTSQPGEIFNLLALNGSGSGCAVLLLDEVDKINTRDDHQILPALLDLLEPETSQEYRDESLGLVFNASHLIILMTSNYREKIDKALLSRCTEVYVAMPGEDQKKAVALHVHAEINQGLERKLRTTLDLESLELMVKNEMSVRELIIHIRKACSVALRNKSRVAKLVPPRKKKSELAKVHEEKRFLPWDTWDNRPFFLQ